MKKINSFEIALSAVACALSTLALTVGTLYPPFLFTGYLLSMAALMLPLSVGQYSGTVLAYIGARLIPFDVQTSKVLEGQMCAIYTCSGMRLALAAAVGSVCVWGIMWLVSRIFARK